MRNRTSDLWIPRFDALPKLKLKLLSLSVKNVLTLNDLINRACRATLAVTQRTRRGLLCFVLAKYCFPLPETSFSRWGGEAQCFFTRGKNVVGA